MPSWKRAHKSSIYIYYYFVDLPFLCCWVAVVLECCQLYYLNLNSMLLLRLCVADLYAYGDRLNAYINIQPHISICTVVCEDVFIFVFRTAVTRSMWHCWFSVVSLLLSFWNFFCTVFDTKSLWNFKYCFCFPLRRLDGGVQNGPNMSKNQRWLCGADNMRKRWNFKRNVEHLSVRFRNGGTTLQWGKINNEWNHLVQFDWIYFLYFIRHMPHTHTQAHSHTHTIYKSDVLCITQISQFLCATITDIKIKLKRNIFLFLNATTIYLFHEYIGFRLSRTHERTHTRTNTLAPNASWYILCN